MQFTSSNLPSIKYIEQYSYDIAAVPLGQGTFGKVFKGSNHQLQIPVAIKVIPSWFLYKDPMHFKFLQREIDNLLNLKISSVVQLLDIKRTENNLYLILSFCNGGDLESRLRNQPLTKSEAQKIFKQIVWTFCEIGRLKTVNEHGHNIKLVHRDLKPANILFHNGKPLVGDFGLSKFLEDPNPNGGNTEGIGSPYYMAPEILKEEPYGIKCDIWSAGVVYYEMLTGKRPWHGFSITELAKNIETQELVFPENVDDKTQDLLRKMLRLKEEERLDWEEVYEHEALRDIDE